MLTGCCGEYLHIRGRTDLFIYLFMVYLMTFIASECLVWKGGMINEYCLIVELYSLVGSLVTDPTIERRGAVGTVAPANQGGCIILCVGNLGG
jgi:uncharacterized membrane protein